MKTKLVVLFASLFIVVSGLTAQDRKRFTPEDAAKNQSEALTKRLDLSDEQKQKVYNIVLKFTKDRRENRTSSKDLSRKEQRELFQKIQQQQTDSIKTVLSDDQKSKYDNILQKMRDRQAKGRRGNRGNRQQ